ncbi:ribokinase [Streptomyces sulfonofaciens]|uniref:Ribokinase n=1 Tax=Streptomyces sulfonofaciens TaxID=68272 RepID=A0A919GI04_9ACTN|nr:sugar kinase [Streptomyces sulfonofaciens]GHH84361.1 ribokinase [Streptomyces sulfonofaciens]
MTARQAPGPVVPAATGDDVLTFGETMVALRGSGPLKLGGSMEVSIAGAESNVAIGLARLGHPVRWAGAVGDDEAGELVLRTLRAEGIDLCDVVRDPEAPTGLILFEPRLPDVTRVHYYRAGSAGSRLDPGALERAFTTRAPRILHLTGITPSLSPSALATTRRALELARAHGSLVCLDVNFRSRLWSAESASAFLSTCVPYVDVLIASDDELPLCLPPEAGDEHRPADATTGTAAGTTDLAKRLLARGIDEVVVKLGPEGAVSHTAHGDLHRPARPVRAVDAVGAGDAFVAGYLSALLDGEDAEARLDRAVTTGAFAVASHGDWEGAPTRSELRLLASTPGTVVR